MHVDRDGARAAAQQLSDAGRHGAFSGALRGIPIGVKDIIDVAGMPTRAGSRLREQHVATCDAEIVARWRAAGAIILGKTATTQFACFDPAETRNPWNPDRTPGGSSSGSAVAVAQGMCLASLGTQTGGSIIRPAAYCGIAGFKPTFGAWSMDGIVPVSFHLDHVGAMAASAADIWHIWQAVCGGGHDSSHELQAASLAPTLLMPSGFFQDLLEAVVRPVFESAIARLAGAGARVEQVALPHCLDDAHRMHRRIMTVELAEYHARAIAEHPDQYALGIAGLIREGLGTPAIDYATALRHRLVCREEVDRIFSAARGIWITPATTSAAPGRETTGDPAMNSPWSYCGLPVVTIPCGYTDDRLPVGVQLIGCRGGEATLLRVARWCESSLE